MNEVLTGRRYLTRRFPSSKGAPAYKILRIHYYMLYFYTLHFKFLAFTVRTKSLSHHMICIEMQYYYMEWWVILFVVVRAANYILFSFNKSTKLQTFSSRYVGSSILVWCVATERLLSSPRPSLSPRPDPRLSPDTGAVSRNSWSSFTSMAMARHTDM